MPERDFAKLLARRVVLLDGGLGSLLISMGLGSGRSPVCWNLEHPARVLELHRRYVEAGSDVIHTNSFGGSPVKLESAGLEGRCREANRTAARLAREAAGDSVLVAGDVGPTGEFFPPMGGTSHERLFDQFRRQVEALLEGGADLISIETMYDRREAEAALKAALDLGAQAMVSLTFEARKRGFFTIVGDRLADTMADLGASGAIAVGMNCSVTPDIMLEMVREAAGETGAPVSAQPNAGQPKLVDGHAEYDADSTEFARQIGEIIDAGARIVGGCCGTDPGFIAAMRGLIDSGRG